MESNDIHLHTQRDLEVQPPLSAAVSNLTEERLRVFCNALSDGYWDLDHTSGELIMSSNLSELLGCSPSEVSNPGTFWTDCLSEAEFQRAIDAYTLHLTSSNQFDLELEFVHTSGEMRIIRVRIESIRDITGVAIRTIGTCTNITQQRIAEDKLKEMNSGYELSKVDRTRELRQHYDRVSTLAASVPGVLYTFEMNSDGTIEYPYVSSGYEHVFGRIGDDAVDSIKRALSHVHHDDTVRVSDAFRDSVSELKPWAVEYRYHHPVRGEVWLESRAIPVTDEFGTVKWHGVTTDTTDHKLRESEMSRLKQDAERRAKLLNTARQVARDILMSRSGGAVARHISEAARELAGAAYAVIVIDGAHILGMPNIVVAGISDQDAALLIETSLPSDFLTEMSSATGLVRMSDFNSRIKLHPPLNQLPDVGLSIGIPIMREGTVLGAMYVGGMPGDEPFGDAEEAAVEALADYAAVAIHYQRQIKQQRSLTQSFVNMLDEERRTVAYELHDGLTQYVISAQVFLDTYCDIFNLFGPNTDANLQKGMDCLRLAVLESRRLVNGLRALTLDEMGLSASLDQMFEEEKQIAEWTTTCFVCNVAYRRFDTDLETSVFRIAQEALSNIRKHAEAKRVSMCLLTSTSDAGIEILTLTIRDWGRGFNSGEISEQPGHLGMRSMRERTRLMEGEFEVVSVPGKGTSIRASFELPMITT